MQYEASLQGAEALLTKNVVITTTLNAESNSYKPKCQYAVDNMCKQKRKRIVCNPAKVKIQVEICINCEKNKTFRALTEPLSLRERVCYA